MDLDADLEPVAPAVRERIEALVRERLDRFGVQGVTVRPALDHDGDPVLMVHAAFGEDAPVVEGRASLDLVSDLRDEAWRLGDRRFPHLRFDYPVPDAPPRARRGKRG